MKVNKQALFTVVAVGIATAATAARADAGAVDYSAITSAVQTGVTNVATGAIGMLSAVIPIAVGALGAMAIWKWGKKLVSAI